MLTIETGIPEESQSSSFMNATLQTIGGLAVSISIYAPEAMRGVGAPAMPEEAVKGELLRAFNNMACDGWEIAIQIGPQDD